jgi:hypothetical protein
MTTDRNDLILNATLPQSATPRLDYFLVDGSYSMQSKWYDTLGALDNYITTLKAGGVTAHGIAHVFCGIALETVQHDAPLSQWPRFSEKPLVSHWGDTPLFDAINLMGRRLAERAPDQCVIVIVTDGDEQGSKYTTVDQARAVLDWCRAQGWQVVFLGADFNNFRQAKALGADESNAIGVRRELLAEAGKLLARKRAAYEAGGDDISFTEGERTTFGGYLTHGGGK